jgi:uncharacterized protein (DUF433 family)
MATNLCPYSEDEECGGNRTTPSGGEPMKFTRITVDPHQMEGLPCIRSLRIPVATVVGMLAEGMTAEEVLQALPDLELADIIEAAQYGVKNRVE